jgi:hypothetical protein
MSNVIAKIFGKAPTTEQIMEEARVTMTDAKVAWGRDRSEASKRAFFAARERFDELEAQHLAAVEAAEEELKKEKERATAKKRTRFAQLRATIDSVAMLSATVVAESKADHVRLCERVERINAFTEERARHIAEAVALAAELGEPFAAKNVSAATLFNDCKDAIRDRVRSREVDRVIAADAAELVSSDWVHRQGGDRGSL